MFQQGASSSKVDNSVHKLRRIGRGFYFATQDKVTQNY